MGSWPAPIIAETDAPEIVRAQPRALYRFFAADGALLYIGRTNDPRLRFEGHKHDKPWWGEVARKTVAWYGCARDVMIAEAVAIRDEGARYNRQAEEIPRWRSPGARPAVADAIEAVRAYEGMPAAGRPGSAAGVIRTVTRALADVRCEAMARATDYGPQGIAKTELGRRLGVGGTKVCKDVTTWRAMGGPDPFDGFPEEMEPGGSGLVAALVALRGLPHVERAREARRLAALVRSTRLAPGAMGAPAGEAG